MEIGIVSGETKIESVNGYKEIIQG